MIEVVATWSDAQARPVVDQITIPSHDIKWASSALLAAVDALTDAADDLATRSMLIGTGPDARELGQEADAMMRRGDCCHDVVADMTGTPGKPLVLSGPRAKEGYEELMHGIGLRAARGEWNIDDRLALIGHKLRTGC